MPENKVVKCFSIKITHDFYSDGVCPDFTFIPSVSCSILMKRYRMFMREIKNGIEVYYTADSSGNALISMSEEKFHFYLHLKNPLLYNFTNIPGDKIYANIFYLSNRQNSNVDSSVLHVSEDSLCAEDMLELKSQRFSFEDDTSSRNLKFILTDSSDVEINQKKAIVEENDNPSPEDDDLYHFIYNVDLENQKAGKFKISLNGNDYKEIYADNFAVRNRYFGVIEIFRKNFTSKSYEIKLTKRTSYWKYIIIPRYQTDLILNKLLIDSTTTFNDVIEDTLSDGTGVAIFKSENEIGFSDKSLSSIKLRLEGQENSVSTLIENLPNASPENLKFDLDTNKAYTEVFVYL